MQFNMDNENLLPPKDCQELVLEKNLNLAKQPDVLLVEDSHILQKMEALLLKISSCSVTLAKTGEEALAVFNNRFDIILLDIDLPDMTGYEVSQIIRKRKDGHKIPIIALTAYEKDVEETCLKAGMNEVLIKPISLYTLQMLLKRYFYF